LFDFITGASFTLYVKGDTINNCVLLAKKLLLRPVVGREALIGDSSKRVRFCENSIRLVAESMKIIKESLNSILSFKMRIEVFVDNKSS